MLTQTGIGDTGDVKCQSVLILVAGTRLQAGVSFAKESTVSSIMMSKRMDIRAILDATFVGSGKKLG